MSQARDAAPTEGARRTAIDRLFIALAEDDHEQVAELVVPDLVISWPQSGERISGVEGCLNVFRNYPGGPPKIRLGRVTGSDRVWVAESDLQYGDETWLGVSIVEFEGDLIARRTDYFAQPFDPPAWRTGLVDPPSRGVSAARGELRVPARAKTARARSRSVSRQP
jgi:hypothetical protein